MPPIEPNDLLVFARVADEGSFARAAARLGVPRSTVSRRIGVLEAALGERLMLRTTRALTLTDFGRAVLEHAHHLVDDVDATTALASHRQAAPSGRLRVSLPGDLAHLVMGRMLAQFAIAYPAIVLEMDLTARFVDLVGENVDVAIRPGSLQDDATLAARRIATFSSSVCAAPAYVARRGAPSEPEALMEHDALLTLSRSGAPLAWSLTRGQSQWQGHPPPRATANSPGLLMQMALEGAGIAVVNDALALPHFERGTLVRLLPDWTLPTTPLWAVFPGRRLMPARTRVFIDALAAHFSGPECHALEREIDASKRGAARSSKDLPGIPRPRRVNKT